LFKNLNFFDPAGCARSLSTLFSSFSRKIVSTRNGSNRWR